MTVTEKTILQRQTLEELIECVKIDDGFGKADKEAVHQQADEALCNLLYKLGYEEVVNFYKEIPKYYA